MNADDAKTVLRVENTSEGIRVIGMIRNPEPSGEDLKRIVELAATFPQPEEVASAMRYAYSLGALAGYGGGEQFGHEMIDSLRKEGHFK